MEQVLSIRNEEFADWLADEPRVIPYLVEGYKTTTPDFGPDLLSDPRSSNNHHWLNQDFPATPKYFMGFEEHRERGLFIISSLYVFPTQRGQGFAKGLIDTAKSLVGQRGVIQVAVEAAKLEELDTFYRKLGFKSIGDTVADPLGVFYRDYFWSRRDFNLRRSDNEIMIEFGQA